jgi:hypothetical protein
MNKAYERKWKLSGLLCLCLLLAEQGVAVVQVPTD